MEDINKEKFYKNSIEPVSIEVTEKIIYQRKNEFVKYIIMVQQEQDFLLKFHLKVEKRQY